MGLQRLFEALTLFLPDIWHICLILGFTSSLLLSILPLVGYWKQNNNLMQCAYPLSIVQCLFVSLSFFGLMLCFYLNDFSVLYVANNSHTQLPVLYRLCAIWGAHEGSLLLWLLLLAWWSVILAISTRGISQSFRAIMLSTCGFISIGFHLFILLTSNPFIRLLPEFPLQGADLNPLLQDFGFVIHPPLLYAGYVGLVIPYAFSMAALVTQTFEKAALKALSNKVLIAYAFLTLGITSGSWWAYYELGWGGWWFWDPVENASLMPWLVSTALVHSIIVTRSIGQFTAWTLFLSIIAFSLSLMGTFLVRSGVLTSVHAFASDPDRGLFVLLFLGLVVGTSLWLFAQKCHVFKKPLAFEPTSKESFMFINNVLLMLSMLTVFIGTLYPLVIEALDMPAISVGPPFFNSVMIPIFIPIIFMMVFGVHATWHQNLQSRVIRRLQKLFLLSIVIGTIIGAWYQGLTYGYFMMGLLSAVWLLLGTILVFVHRVMELKSKSGQQNGLSYVSVFKSLSPSFWGMCIAHTGLAIAILGMSITSHFDIEKDVKLSVGQEISIGGYQFALEKLQSIEGGNFIGTQATFKISEESGKGLAVNQNDLNEKQDISNMDEQRSKGIKAYYLYPEKRLYTARNMPMSEAAILTLLPKDIYIALGEQLDEQTWTMRLYIKPFVRTMWLGAILIALGALLSVLFRRLKPL